MENLLMILILVGIFGLGYIMVMSVGILINENYRNPRTGKRKTRKSSLKKRIQKIGESLKQKR